MDDSGKQNVPDGLQEVITTIENKYAPAYNQMIETLVSLPDSSVPELELCVRLEAMTIDFWDPLMRDLGLDVIDFELEENQEKSQGRNFQYLPQIIEGYPWLMIFNELHSYVFYALAELSEEGELSKSGIEYLRDMIKGQSNPKEFNETIESAQIRHQDGYKMLQHSGVLNTVQEQMIDIINERARVLDASMWEFPEITSADIDNCKRSEREALRSLFELINSKVKNEA